jgi:hypothetical protein
MTVLASKHRSATHLPVTVIDSVRDADLDFDHSMEPAHSNAVQEPGDSGSIGLYNIDDEQPALTPSPGSIANYGGPATITRSQEVDSSTNIHTLPRRTPGCVYVALPDVFDGRKENYRQFQRQFGLFLMVNREEFKEKESMIWFTLSYMKGGATELWANAYVDNALETNDWRTWEEFLDKLAWDFRNKEELRKALEELGHLQQGKRMAVEFFLKFKQLASVAGVDLNWYPNTVQYVERNIQHVLIDQIYQSDNPPRNYQEYKWHLIVMDKMRRRREIYKGTAQSAVHRPQDTSAMEVDHSGKRDKWKCFVCSKEGHLARACPDREWKQGF